MINGNPLKLVTLSPFGVLNGMQCKTKKKKRSSDKEEMDEDDDDNEQKEELNAMKITKQSIVYKSSSNAEINFCANYNVKYLPEMYHGLALPNISKELVQCRTFHIV